MLALYRFLTFLCTPLVWAWLRLRARRGKEDKARMGERFGHTDTPRPAGRLLWVHAASVGETRSILPLLDAMTEARPDLNILLTTGTVTSARDVAPRLPAGTVHQFVPVDLPGAVERFFNHWQPDAGMIVESELWPNLLGQAAHAGVPLVLVNARLSDRSFRRWKKVAGSARKMLSVFRLVLAQDSETAERFKQLGAAQVMTTGNLKFAAPPLPCDEAELGALRAELGDRPLWLAASTHRGEEEQLGMVHQILKRSWPDILTIIVPRHPERGAEVAGDLRAMGLITRIRSSGKTAGMERADIYIADTMGELGLFYTLCPAAFIGGSLVPHGGQNPLEPARLDCAVITGPHIFNFEPTYAALKKAEAANFVSDADDLARAVKTLLQDDAVRAVMAGRAAEIAFGNTQVLPNVCAAVLPIIDGEA